MVGVKGSIHSSIYKFITAVCNYIRNNDIQLLNWQVYGIHTAGKTGDWETLAGSWENAIGISLKRTLDSYPLKSRGVHAILTPFSREDGTPTVPGQYVLFIGCVFNDEEYKFYIHAACKMSLRLFSYYYILGPYPFTPPKFMAMDYSFLEELAFERASQWLPTLGTCQDPHRSNSQLWRPDFLNWARASACTNLLSSSGDWDVQQSLRSPKDHDKFKVIK